MSFNPYRRLVDLLPQNPLQVGEVVGYADGVATIELPDGGIEQARGEATVGSRVYFRGGAIEGPAPDLSITVIEV